MQLFANSFQGRVVTNFFELHPKTFSTWEELCYWFKYTYGQPRNPIDILFDYNNASFSKGGTLKPFNTHLTKLYSQFLKIIQPQNQAETMHYYSAFPSPYRQ